MVKRCAAGCCAGGTTPTRTVVSRSASVDWMNARYAGSPMNMSSGGGLSRCT
jgi:hypothetical protein